MFRARAARPRAGLSDEAGLTRRRGQRDQFAPVQAVSRGQRDVLAQFARPDREAGSHQFVEELGVEQVHLPQVGLARVGPYARPVLDGAAPVRITHHAPADFQLDGRHLLFGKAVFCIAVDRNGYVPCHNRAYNNAQRPGDVVRTMGGKTIEVLNTDAEGRLVLADAVQYVAARHRPSAIVDIATLTGAVVGALGDEYAGLFARDEALGTALVAAGEASGEAVWRLPLHANHYDDLKSDIADLKNVVEGGGPGASLGAAFIGSFVDEALPWAHVDMAGTMWSSGGSPTVPKGATGYGVRLLEEFVRNWSANR
mgnify:CR=1 FL=1